MGFNQFLKSTFDPICDVSSSQFKCAFSRRWIHRISRFLFALTTTLFFALIVLFDAGRPGIVFDILYSLLAIYCLYAGIRLNLHGERYFVDLRMVNDEIHLTYRKYFKVVDIRFPVIEAEYFLSDSIHLRNGESIKFLIADRIKPLGSIEPTKTIFERFFDQLIAKHNSPNLENERV